MPSLGRIAVRVQLLGLAGLASTHRAPYVRVRYNDARTRRHGHRRHCRHEVDHVECRIVSIELPEDKSPPRSRTRDGDGRYTVRWGPPTTDACVVFLPVDVEFVEIEAWNDFGDVAVSLGAVAVAIAGAVDEVGDTWGKELWYPLQQQQQQQQCTRRDVGGFHGSWGLLPVSVLVRVGYEVDERIVRREQRRRVRRAADVGEEPPHSTTNPDASDPIKGSVDPSFEFIEPHARIEWSTIVATNVRRLFLRGDVDELMVFWDDVLYGDMEREIDEDDGLHVHEDHLRAFRLCQLSAQYLAHCIDTLQARRDDYDDQRAVLTAQRERLLRRRRDLRRERETLNKEHADTDKLLTMYQSLLAQRGQSVEAAESTALQQTRPPRHDDSHQTTVNVRGPSEIPSTSSLGSPSESVVSKKPAFLMTWEERELARKQMKELDKTRRIEEEKARLQRLFHDRQERERYELGLNSLMQRRRQRCATVIQVKIRQFLQSRRQATVAHEHHAARRIQSRFRAYACARRWPKLREKERARRERTAMATCEDEMRTFMARERENPESQPEPRGAVTTDAFSDWSSDGQLSPSSTKPVETMELVRMWRKFRRIFSVACERGVSSTALFARLDYRLDGVIDRAEFRIGARSFGLRIDRRMTRALISLVRAKCDAPPRPLRLSLGQFIAGFELPLPSPDADEFPITDRKIRSSEKLSSSSGSKPTSANDRRESDVEHQDEHEEISSRIEQVASAVSTLRKRVLEAATDHLSTKGKSTSDYFAFRQALTHVFEEFDVDQNGELDVQEFATCMESIDFHVTPENLAILRECFVQDPSSDTISIAEFISFALAGSSNRSGTPEEGELGILGFRLRDAILNLVKTARRQTESIDDAVRLVFKRAFRTKQQKACPQVDLIRVLASLRLGFTPAQLSRLVLRLDLDGDQTISFEELMIWLRLRHRESLGMVRTPSPLSDGRTTAVRQASTVARENAALAHKILLKLAELDCVSLTREQQWQKAANLFQSIDNNGSGKVNAEELRVFLEDVNIDGLTSVMGSNQFERPLTADALAKQIIQLIDVRGTGVVTLDAWVNHFVKEGSMERVERVAVVESIRQSIIAIGLGSEPELLAWFREIPGAISVHNFRGVEMKVRVHEFKNAVKSKLPYVTSKDVDEVARALDVDNSNWITEAELTNWMIPTRDPEEIMAIVAKRWLEEYRKTNNLPPDEFTARLYKRFDVDNNGTLARLELRSGFVAFRIYLSDAEASAFISKFDRDNDGCWNRAEFDSCVKSVVFNLLQGEPMAPTGEAERELEDESEGYNSSNYSLASSHSDQQSTIKIAPRLDAVEYSEDFDGN